MALMASGMALTMAPATESIMGSLPLGKAGVGSAVNDTTRQVGGALGVAVIGSVLASIYGSQVGDFLQGKPVPTGTAARASSSRSASRSPAGKTGARAAHAPPSTRFIDGMHAGRARRRRRRASSARSIAFVWLPGRAPATTPLADAGTDARGARRHRADGRGSGTSCS